MRAPEFDREAFDRLFEAHYEQLHRFARRRLADEAAVDDTVAETFVIAWRRRADLPDPPLPWLYAVCIRVMATSRRGASRRNRLLGRLRAMPVEPSRDPADSYESRAVIAHAFAALPEDKREVLRLIAWDGLSTEEAAIALDCSPSAFRTRYHRARRALETQLASAGHEETDPPTTLSEVHT